MKILSQLVHPQELLKKEMNNLLYSARQIKKCFIQIYYRWIFWGKVIKQNGSVSNILIVNRPKYIKLGKNVRFNKHCRIECYDKYLGIELKPKLTVGKNVIIGPNFTGFIADNVTIGDRCLFAGNVSLISENHGINPETSDSYQKEPLTTGPINIGEGCWLGQNVVVLPNVTIGERCIIGSNSVVNSDIPAYSIAVGAPAHIIKTYNFQEHRWESVK